MPNIVEIEYTAGYPSGKDGNFVEFMKTSFSFELYNKLSKSELDSWLHAILMSCPAYEDKEDLGNHIHWNKGEIKPSEKIPF